MTFEVGKKFLGKKQVNAVQCTARVQEFCVRGGEGENS